MVPMNAIGSLNGEILTFEKPRIIECDRPRWVGFSKDIDNWNKPGLMDPCHPLCCFVKIMRLKEGFSLSRAVRHLRDLPHTNTENDEFLTSVKPKLVRELEIASLTWCKLNKIDGIIGGVDQNKHMLKMIISKMEAIECSFWKSYKCKVLHTNSRIKQFLDKMDQLLPGCFYFKV